MRSKLVAGTIGSLALLPALATAPQACFPQGQCSSTSTEYCAPGDPACVGHLIDPYTWQSGPIDTPWLAFPREGSILLHLRDAVTGQSIQGQIYEPLVYISPEADASAPGSQFAGASGNNGEWSWAAGPDNTSITLRNDTCSDYFFYVVVHAYPDGTAPDAGADASQDAATE